MTELTTLLPINCQGCHPNPSPETKENTLGEESVFFWLALANELRIASMDYDDSQVRNVKSLLLAV